MQQQLNEKFDLWCLVELFGHTKIAGRCTEQNIAGTNMLRVDVPETSTQPAFSRFFGAAAIYAINPVDEETCKYYAEQLDRKPIDPWDVKRMLEKNDRLRLQLTSATNQSSEEDIMNPVFIDDDDDDD